MNTDYYTQQRRLADANEVFLLLVKDGMTREDLAENIRRRPELWGRYSHWLDRLPRRQEKP